MGWNWHRPVTECSTGSMRTGNIVTRSKRSPPRSAVNPLGLLSLIAMLGVSATGLAGDYPPPPGPYPSGPLPAAGGGGQILDGAQPETVARPVPGDRPGLLLPDAPDASETGTYGATNLFGSAPAAADPAPPPAAAFAPTEPASPYLHRDVDAAPATPVPTGIKRETQPGQQAAVEPQTYRPNTPVVTGGDYRPPAYPVERGVPPYAGPGMPQQPWHGGPQYDAGTPAMPVQPAPVGGPVFRPPG